MNCEDGIVNVLREYVDSLLEQVHTCMPGRVESYDESTHEATIKPLIRMRQKSGVLIDIPPIANVPIMLPSTGVFSLEYPLSIGDEVLILFSETSIGNWLESSAGSMADPEDTARFCLTDAIAIPGLWPFSVLPQSKNSIKISKTGEITVVNEAGATVVMDASGLISVKNQTASLKSLMDALWSDLQGVASDLALWAAGNVPPASPATNAQLIAMGTALAPRITSMALTAQQVSTLLK